MILKPKFHPPQQNIQGELTAFDFGEEGDKLVEIVTDPLLYNATVESGKLQIVIFIGVKTF